ncbi:hypothetical protein WDA79_08270 [Streptomyces sp. A475]|uniref:hypothetical protein n=1 Tax=Streptomyces sp. A475 TaxID=3131976 RepID=UPI0030C985BE
MDLQGGMVRAQPVDHNSGIPLNHPTPHHYTHRGKFLNRLHVHLQNHVQRLLAHAKDEDRDHGFTHN